MKSQMYDSVDPISILNNFSLFIWCLIQTWYIQEPPFGFSTSSMKCPVAAFSTGLALKPKSHKHQKGGPVASYCEAVNYLLNTYGKGNVIAETDTDMMKFPWPSNKSP